MKIACRWNGVADLPDSDADLLSGSRTVEPGAIDRSHLSDNPSDSPSDGPSDHDARIQELRQEIRRRWGVPSATLAAGVGDETACARDVLSTGCAMVDELLPGGGVPRGRLTEVSGSLSSGKTSLVASLAAQVLRGQERVAWVDPKHAFYAPSAARAGVSLDDLWLVRPPRVSVSSLLARERTSARESARENAREHARERAREHARENVAGAADVVVRDEGAEPDDTGQRVPPRNRGPFEFFRAAEHLIQSKAFALVVLDAVGIPGRGIASPLFRMSRLALRCHTAVVLITDHPDRVSSLGSCVALRLRIERRSYCFDPEPRPPFDLAGYRIEVQVGKTKLGPAGAPRLVEVRSPGGVAV